METDLGERGSAVQALTVALRGLARRSRVHVLLLKKVADCPSRLVPVGSCRIYPWGYIVKPEMRYTEKEKRKLANRLSRVRGQIEAMQAALENDASCTALLQQAVACRGAMDGFIGTVIEHHVLQHVADPGCSEEGRALAAEELIKVVHAYLT